MASVSLNLQGKPFPLPLFTRGTKVRVYMGCGFSVGYVIDSAQDHCQVELAVGSRRVTVKDARCIQRF